MSGSFYKGLSFIVGRWMCMLGCVVRKIIISEGEFVEREIVLREWYY